MIMSLERSASSAGSSSLRPPATIVTALPNSPTRSRTTSAASPSPARSATVRPRADHGDRVPERGEELGSAVNPPPTPTVAKANAESCLSSAAGSRRRSPWSRHLGSVGFLRLSGLRGCAAPGGYGSDRTWSSSTPSTSPPASCCSPPRADEHAASRRCRGHGRGVRADQRARGLGARGLGRGICSAPSTPPASRWRLRGWSRTTRPESRPPPRSPAPKTASHSPEEPEASDHPSRRTTRG